MHGAERMPQYGHSTGYSSKGLLVYASVSGTSKLRLFQMAVGLRRRQIAVCELQSDRISTSLELDTDDIPLTLVSTCFSFPEGAGQPFLMSFLEIQNK